MATAPASAEFEPLISHSAIHEAMRDALRLFAGRGKRYSVVELGLGAGIDPKNLDRAMRPVWAGDYRALKHHELASVAKFLGASFVSQYLEVSGLGAFDLSETPPLPKVLASADAPESVEDERRRIVRRLAELEGIQ